MFNVGDRVICLNAEKGGIDWYSPEGTIYRAMNGGVDGYFIDFDNDKHFKKGEGRHRYDSELRLATPSGPEVYEEWFK